MAQQVRNAPLQRRQVLIRQLLLVQAAVHLQGAHRTDHDHCVRSQAGHAALDIQELLRAEVRAEAGFGHCIIAHAHSHAGRHHGVAAVGDVREGTAVHEGRGAFQRLDEVGLQRIAQQGCHGAGRLQISGGHGLVVIGIGYDDPAQALLQVRHGGSQAEHRHDLACHGDIETVLAGRPVGPAAQSVHHEPQLAVVHVHATLPGDLLHIDTKGVPLLDVVVQHRCEQVVRCADGVEVAGEVQVDILHGHDLSITAARCAALDAKDRAKARFPQRHGHILADPGQAVRQADRRGGLALACRSRRDCSHEHQLAGLPVRLVDQGRIDLGLITAVLLHIFFIHVGFLRDFHDRLHLTLLGDLDICQVGHFTLPPISQINCIFRLQGVGDVARGCDVACGARESRL